MTLQEIHIEFGNQYDSLDKVLNRDARSILEEIGIFERGHTTLGEKIDNILGEITSKGSANSSSGSANSSNGRTNSSNGRGNTTISSGNGPLFNTYPFGKRTNKLHPCLLAICKGKKRLKTVFDYVINHSSKMRSLREEKTVIIFTDKWNNSTFEQYEEELAYNALNYGIHYIILLFNNYGITHIPFLPARRW